MQNQIIQQRPARLKIGSTPSGQPHSEPPHHGVRPLGFIYRWPAFGSAWRAVMARCRDGQL